MNSNSLKSELILASVGVKIVTASSIASEIVEDSTTLTTIEETGETQNRISQRNCIKQLVNIKIGEYPNIKTYIHKYIPGQ